MLQSYDYDRDDPTFVDDLVNGQQYEWLIARWLSERGYDVTKRALRIRPESSRMQQYSDGGDLEIIFRVEVKRRNIDFTSRETYPYDTVIVDVAHTFDSARTKPYCYFILNTNATCFALVMVKKTQNQWIKSKRFDASKNRERTFYECPVELCSFHQMGID